MKLLVQSAMIFFGTLMAAGLLALGEPAPAPRMAAGATPQQAADGGQSRTAAAETASQRR